MTSTEQWRERATRATRASVWAMRLGILIIVLAMLGTRVSFAAVDEATAARTGLWIIGVGVMFLVAMAVLSLSAWRMRALADEAEADVAARAELRKTYGDIDDATADRILGDD